MTLIPHRTVASQVAAQLRTEIARGTWQGWLPGERMLSDKVQASRNSVRLALEQLKADGLVESVHGVGNKIVATPSARLDAKSPGRSVGLLIPDHVGRLRPFTALWIDELKDLLLEEGCRLRIHEGRQWYLANPAKTLERLVDQNRHDAWVITLSSVAMQKWFQNGALPCLVAGSTFEGVALPSHDLDYRAACRHAAGVLMRAGHKRLAFLNRETKRAGDLDSEIGFLEGVRGASLSDVTAEIAYHGDDMASVFRALKRVLDRGEPCTGLLVSSSYAYLSVITLLAQRGLKVPTDISILSRDDDPFLDAIAPAPGRYVASPHSFAKKMLTPLLRLLAREPLPSLPSRFLPKYSAGCSVGEPPKGKA